MHESTKLKNRLKELAGKAGELVYERIGIASKLLADAAWIAEEFPPGFKEVDGKRIRTGGEEEARDTLEADYFGDLCSALTLGQLLAIYTSFPDIADWRRHNFHLMRLWAEHLEKTGRSKNKDETEPRTRWKELAEQAQEDLAHFKAVANKQQQDASKLSKTVTELRQELAEKDRVIARLEGRIQELERMLERHMAVA